MPWSLVAPRPSTVPVWRVVSVSGGASLGGAAKPKGALVAVPQVGPPGPQGPAGPMGPSGGAGVERVADVALGGHRVVRATSVDGVDYASNDQPSHRDVVIGITSNAASSGGAVSVVSAGAMTEGSWSWTPGLPIYAGLNGALTQTPPVSGWLRILGFATSPTSIVVQLLPPIVLS